MEKTRPGLSKSTASSKAIDRRVTRAQHKSTRAMAELTTCNSITQSDAGGKSPTQSASGNSSSIPISMTDNSNQSQTPQTETGRDTSPAPRTESRSGSKSPDPNCSICLEGLENKSFTDSCFHMFCFSCLLEWSKVKAECPLCKQPFSSIIHNVRSYDDYDQYHIHKQQGRSDDTWHYPWDNFGNSDGYRFRYRTTLTLDRMQTHLREQMHQLAELQGPHAVTTRMQWHRYRQASSADFRRQVYHSNLRVHHVVRRASHTRVRDTSPEFFRRNPACIHRLVPWLNRELNALMFRHPENTQFVLELILDLIKRFFIASEDFYQHIQPFIGNYTQAFVHEFLSFAQSPYDMIAYDHNAVYEPAIYDSEAADINASNSPASSDSDVVIISPDRTDQSPEVLTVISPVRYPTLPSETHNPEPPTWPPQQSLFPLLTRIDSCLRSPGDRLPLNCTGWESPLAGPSGIFIDSTSSFPSIDSDIDVVNISNENESELQMKRKPKPTRAIRGNKSVSPSNSSTNSYISVTHHSDVNQDRHASGSDSSDEDVLIVDFEKPWEQRSPVMLSSDSEEEIIVHDIDVPDVQANHSIDLYNGVRESRNAHANNQVLPRSQIKHRHNSRRERSKSSVKKNSKQNHSHHHKSKATHSHSSKEDLMNSNRHRNNSANHDKHTSKDSLVDDYTVQSVITMATTVFSSCKHRRSVSSDRESVNYLGYRHHNVGDFNKDKRRKCGHSDSSQISSRAQSSLSGHRKHRNHSKDHHKKHKKTQRETDRSRTSSVEIMSASSSDESNSGKHKKRKKDKRHRRHRKDNDDEKPPQQASLEQVKEVTTPIIRTEPTIQNLLEYADLPDSTFSFDADSVDLVPVDFIDFGDVDSDFNVSSNFKKHPTGHKNSQGKAYVTLDSGTSSMSGSERISLGESSHSHQDILNDQECSNAMDLNQMIYSHSVTETDMEKASYSVYAQSRDVTRDLSVQDLNSDKLSNCSNNMPSLSQEYVDSLCDNKLEHQRYSEYFNISTCPPNHIVKESTSDLSQLVINSSNSIEPHDIINNMRINTSTKHIATMCHSSAQDGQILSSDTIINGNNNLNALSANSEHASLRHSKEDGAGEEEGAEIFSNRSVCMMPDHTPETNTNDRCMADLNSPANDTDVGSKSGSVHVINTDTNNIDEDTNSCTSCSPLRGLQTSHVDMNVDFAPMEYNDKDNITTVGRRPHDCNSDCHFQCCITNRTELLLSSDLTGHSASEYVQLSDTAIRNYSPTEESHVNKIESCVSSKHLQEKDSTIPDKPHSLESSDSSDTDIDVASESPACCHFEKDGQNSPDNSMISDSGVSIAMKAVCSKHQVGEHDHCENV